MEDRSPRAWWAVAGVAVIAAGLALERLASRQLNQVLLNFPGVDKALHVAQSLAVFLLLYYLAQRLLASLKTSLLIAAAGTLLVAIADELQQLSIAERHVEVADVVAGASGLLAGIAIVVAARAPRRAALAATGALVIAGFVTYRSYAETKDYNRGLVLEAQGRFSEARKHFALALEAGRPSAALYNHLAWTEIESGEGDAQRAVEYAERSLAMRPEDPDALDTYGWALAHAGRPRDALAALERAYALEPDIYCIHYHLAVAHLLLGDEETARKHLERQVAAAPDSPEADKSRQLLQSTSPLIGGLKSFSK
jgi:tetratricopeptide (TPR) repeat protein